MGVFDRAAKDAKDQLKDQYLGKGSRVSGKLNFDGTVQIDGHVDGEISAQETLILGEGAVVTAQISGDTVVIKGQVRGDMNARKQIEICAPGKFYGNIGTPSLVIHEGAIFRRALLHECSQEAQQRLRRDALRQGRETKPRRPRSRSERSNKVALSLSQDPAGRVIYVENAGDFLVPLDVVAAVHSQKVIFECRKLDPRLRRAIGHAHDAEKPGF
jgi:cytoskeletal protein CcmA (bactofilin family)